MMTIVNALHLLKKTGWKPSRIVINTDCLNAIHLFTKNREAVKKYKLLSPQTIDITHAYFKACNQLPLFTGPKGKRMLPMVELRHIRSHQHTETAKHWVNDWADKEAKRIIGNYIDTHNERTRKKG